MEPLDYLVDAIAIRDHDADFALNLNGRAIKLRKNQVFRLRKRIALLNDTRGLTRLCQRTKLTPGFLHINRSTVTTLTKHQQTLVQETVDKICSLYLEHLDTELTRAELSLSQILPKSWSLPDSPSLRPLVNVNESCYLEKQIAALTQEMAASKLDEQPLHREPIHILKRPLFWTNCLDATSKQLCKDCQTQLILPSVGEAKSLSPYSPERSVDS